ncbi:hypothetical protein BHM03_00043924 [Ensete ventricosum]|nr:hypothetical protein BHM03_00043924 [Ensete ventricosum]
MNLVGMKKAVVAQAPHLEMSRPATEPIVERPMQGDFTNPRHKVWMDKADAQVFYRAILSLLLAEEIYTTPSKVLVEIVAKNLVMKLKDESGLVAVATVEARANEAIVKLDEVQRGEAEDLEKVKAPGKELQGLKVDMEAAWAKN